MLVRARGARRRLRKPSSTTLVPLPCLVPTASPFPAGPAFKSLPRTLQSAMGRDSRAAGARIAPESASAPPCRPEPGLCSPLPSLYSRASSPLSAPPVLTTRPTRYRWFGSGSGSGSGPGSRGVLVRLRAPDALPALIPCFLPLPLGRLAGSRLRLQTPVPRQARGGKDGQGRPPVGSGGRLRQRRPREGEEMGGAAAAAQGSRTPWPVAGPGPGGWGRSAGVWGGNESPAFL